jgi:Tol biopolymer transport system component
MSSARTWLILTVAILSCVCAAAPAAAQATAVNGRIAFTVCEFGVLGILQCDIWVMNPDGSGQLNLTNTPDLDETDPSWSPDGTRIAYVEGTTGVNRLMIINADGSARAVVTPEPSFQFRPTWSPGGSRLAFVRQVPGVVMSIQFDILAINVDGSGEVNLTNSDFDEVDPAWAPDDSKIAFAGVRFESTLDPNGQPVRAAQWEIVTINPDGSGEQILSAGDAGSTRALLLEEDRAPSWSPDSSRLVFMTQSVDPCCPPWQIAEVGRDGTALVALSDNPDVNDVAPAYSPDGTLIVFTSDRDAVVGGQFDIYTMPSAQPAAALLAAPAAASVTRLTTGGNATDPSWGRDPDSAPPPAEFTLAVSVEAGPGARGLVVSWPRGIVCGRDCMETYPTGTVVALLAVPNLRSRFAGWSGACAGRSLVCIVRMDAAQTVEATFARSR